MCREAAWAEQAVKVTFAVRFSTQDVRIKIKIQGAFEGSPFCAVKVQIFSFQSTSPRSVRRSSGRQARGISAMVIKGDGMEQPICFQEPSRFSTS